MATAFANADANADGRISMEDGRQGEDKVWVALDWKYGAKYAKKHRTIYSINIQDGMLMLKTLLAEIHVA